MKKPGLGLLTAIIFFSCTFSSKKQKEEPPVTTISDPAAEPQKPLISLPQKVDTSKLHPPVIIVEPGGKKIETIQKKAGQMLVKPPKLDTIAVH